MQRLLLTPLLILLLGTCVRAQETSILVPRGDRTFEAITWTDDGRIITCDFNNGRLFGIRRDGGLDTLLQGLTGPLGGSADPAGNFYFSEFGTSNLRMMRPDGTDTILATGLGQPTGTLYDEATGRVLVADYSVGRLFAVHLADGSVETLVDSTGTPGLNGPDGIVRAHHGGYLVANYNDNKVHHLAEDGTLSLFATLTDCANSGYLTRLREGYLIVGLGCHRIFHLAADGTLSPWAGSGEQAFVNHPNLDSVAFSIPNGIALSPDGDSLVISENTSIGQIRLITGLNAFTSVRSAPRRGFNELRVYPQPAANRVITAFAQAAPGEVGAELLGLDGRLLRRYARRRLSAGNVSAEWPLPALISGTYLLRLSGEDGREETSRVVVE